MTDAIYLRLHGRRTILRPGTSELVASVAAIGSRAVYATSTPGGHTPLGEIDLIAGLVPGEGRLRGRAGVCRLFSLQVSIPNWACAPSPLNPFNPPPLCVLTPAPPHDSRWRLLDPSAVAGPTCPTPRPRRIRPFPQPLWPASRPSMVRSPPTSSEAAVGNPVSYLVSQREPPGVGSSGIRRQPGPPDLGLACGGSRDDQLATLTAFDLPLRWYASPFPGGQFSAPLDVGDVLGFMPTTTPRSGSSASLHPPRIRPRARPCSHLRRPGFAAFHRFPFAVGAQWSTTLRR